MRKSTLLLLAAALTLSTAAQAKTVTPAEARAIAAGYVTLAPQTSADRQTLRVKAATGAMADIYVFNDARGQGFVLIPGDDCVGSVLGYSHSGSVDTGNLPPALSAWLSLTAADIAAAQRSDLPVVPRRALAVEGTVEPLLTTTWNQTAPYNNYTPTISGRSTYTGCVQTALAQIMNYHEWPATGTGTVTHSVPNCDQKSVTYDLSQSSYDWNAMLDTYVSGQYTTTQGNAVAKLMRDLGAVMHASYLSTATGAYETDAPNALGEHFSYDAHVYAHDVLGREWYTRLLDELRAARPVMICGETSDAAHAFVADGYDADGYLHINWGWGGYGDGYFRMGHLGDTEDYRYAHRMVTLTPDRSGAAFTERQNDLYYGAIGIYDPVYSEKEEYTVQLGSASTSTAVSLSVYVLYLSMDYEHPFNGQVRLGLYDADSGEYVTSLGEAQTATITNTPPSTNGYAQPWFDLSRKTLAALPDGHYRVKVESCNTRRDGTSFGEWVIGRPDTGVYSLALKKTSTTATFYYIDDLNVTDVQATLTPAASSVILGKTLATAVRLEQTSPWRFEGTVRFNCTDLETGNEEAFARTDTLLIYPGEVAKANYDLPVTSKHFQAGHRYRITVSGQIYDETISPMTVADAPVIYVGDATGISSVSASDASAAPAYYDLTGRRLSAPACGVVIVRQGGETSKRVGK